MESPVYELDLRFPVRARSIRTPPPYIGQIGGITQKWGMWNVRSECYKLDLIGFLHGASETPASIPSNRTSFNGRNSIVSRGESHYSS